ncbi:hypothetical protein CN918_29595 [Priestia megaterium]|nr:hypothetical protein CN918_29595 [Priestia megaterium]
MSKQKPYSKKQALMLCGDNDNEGLNHLQGIKLYVDSVATNKEEAGYGYDEGLNGEPLYSLKKEDGTPIGDSLYHFQLEPYKESKFKR